MSLAKPASSSSSAATTVVDVATPFSLGTALLLSALAVANLLGSFLIQWAVVLSLGTGEQTDALFAALTVPQIVLSISAASLTHVLVALLVAAGGDDLRQRVWTLLALITGLGAAAAAVLHALAPIWVAWLVPGFTPATRALAVELTRIQLPGVVFAASISVLWAAYRARRRFVWPELSSFVSIVATFGILLWGLPRYGIRLAAWALMLRAGIQVAVLMPAAGRFCTPDFRAPAVTEAWSKIKPLLMGNAYYKLEPAVDRYLASMAGIGGVSLLYLAQQIYGTAAQILNAAVTVPMVPALAGHAERADWSAFRRLYRHRMALVIVVSASLYIAVLIAGRPALLLAIGDQRLRPRELDQLWRILAALGGLLIAGAAGQILASTFYATGDTRTLMRIGLAVFTSGIIFKAVGFAQGGLEGLAIGTSLYYLVSAGVQYVVLKSRHSDRACNQA